MSASGSHVILSLVLVLGSGAFIRETACAWAVDGNGEREFSLTELLEVNRAKMARDNVLSQLAPPVTCARGDVIVGSGVAWTERCRQCNCSDGVVRCTEGPPCALPYERRQESTCAKWTDGCCCELEGCLLDDGTYVPVGGAVPRNAARPCDNCTCMGGNRTHCLVQSCWPYECVDMAAPLPGECCPSCPNGKSCLLPHNEWQKLSANEQRVFPPIRESSPLTLRAGLKDEVTCRCEGKLIAVCTSSTPSSGDQGSSRNPLPWH